VVLIGDCRVEYEGRASSVLEWGERVAIVKQDGSVLVHRPVGYEPVNWQPAKCVLRAALPDPGTLVVTASRSQPRETVSIHYRALLLAAAGQLLDQGEFALHVTEEQMKQAILLSPGLVEAGLKPIEQEKSLGAAGFTDIIAEDKEGNLVVIEIKRNAATKHAVLQLERYLDTIRKRNPRKFRGLIVAPELRKTAEPVVTRLNLQFVRLHPEKCFNVLKTQRDMRLSQFLNS